MLKFTPNRRCGLTPQMTLSFKSQQVEVTKKSVSKADSFRRWSEVQRHRRDEEQLLVAERLTCCRFDLFSCLQGTVLDESTEEEEGAEAEHVQVDMHKHPLKAPANFSILWILHRSSTHFVSRRERRNSKSSLCHREDSPSAWIRYQLCELTVNLCTSANECGIDAFPDRCEGSAWTHTQQRLKGGVTAHVSIFPHFQPLRLSGGLTC